MNQVPCYVCAKPAPLSKRKRCVDCEYTRSVANETENDQLREQIEILREQLQAR